MMTIHEAIRKIQTRNTKYMRQYIPVAERGQEIILIDGTDIFVRLYTHIYSKTWQKRGYEIFDRATGRGVPVTLWELKRLAKQMEVSE